MSESSARPITVSRPLAVTLSLTMKCKEVDLLTRSSSLFSISSAVDAKEQSVRESPDKHYFQTNPTDMHLFSFFFSVLHLHFTAPHCTPHFAPPPTTHQDTLSFPPPPPKRLGSVGPSAVLGTIEVTNTLSVLIFLYSLIFLRVCF